MPCFTEVTYIYVHNLLIVYGFIAKIDNKFSIILIVKLLVNKFIGHLFPFLCIFRDLDSACFISLYACYSEISMYVLTGSPSILETIWIQLQLPSLERMLI